MLLVYNAMFQADSVLKLLQEKLQIPNVLLNVNDFVKKLEDEDSFVPYGEKLCSFSVDQGSILYKYYCSV